MSKIIFIEILCYGEMRSAVSTLNLEKQHPKSENLIVIMSTGSIIKNSFQSYVVSISYRTSLSHFWNNIKVLKSKWSKIKKTESLNQATLEERIENSIQILCSPWVLVNPKIEFEIQSNDFLDKTFNFMEFNVAIEKVSPDSSPGHDRIEYKMIKSRSSRSSFPNLF